MQVEIFSWHIQGAFQFYKTPMHNEFAIEEFGLWIDGIPKYMQADVEFDYSKFSGMVHYMLDDPNGGKETEVYFYHSDHLGSASWITDFSGVAVQHIQYLPYGEPYINQHPFGYSERFTFTGKEKDEETGYGYFGARYMDHELMTMWLSVDPLADKYPGISPYAYCAWNPVKLVDPDGREMWKPEMLEDGTINYVKEKGDNAKTLQEQYNLSEDAATKLYATMKDGKISGESAKVVTGNEVLKLRAGENSTERLLYHLGFSIMYNHEKQGDRSMRLNEFFSGLPQDVGANCQTGTPGFFSRKTNKNYSVPVKGGTSIPVTYFNFSCPGNALITRDFEGITERRPGTVNLKMNFTDGSITNGIPAIIIQVPKENKTIFEASYGN